MGMGAEQKSFVSDIVGLSILLTNDEFRCRFESITSSSTLANFQRHHVQGTFFYFNEQHLDLNFHNIKFREFIVNGDLSAFPAMHFEAFRNGHGASIEELTCC